MAKRVTFLCIILSLLLSTVGFAYDETYERAVKHFRSREYRSSIQYLEDYASRKPDPAVYYLLGYAYYQLGNYEKSHEYFDQAYLIDPEFSSDKVPAHAGLSHEEQGFIHDALELSGVRKQMGYYAGIVSSSIPRIQESMSKERIKQDLTAIVKDSYRVDRTYPSMVSAFSARFNRGHLLLVIQWLKSPLGRKMTELEIEASRPEAMQKSVAYAGEYEKLPEGRMLLIKRIETNLRATDLNSEVAAVSLFEMLKGMQSQMRDRSRLSSSEIDELVEHVRGMPREQLTRDVLLSLAYTYRNLGDEELRAVLRFYETPAGKWFHETCIESISAAIGKASRDIGEKIGEILVLRRLTV